MIDVSQITDERELKEIKDALNFFINKKVVADIYKDDGKEDIELFVDRQLARELLVKVTARMKRLSQPSRKWDSKPR